MNALLEGAACRPDPIRRRLLQGVALGMVAPALPAAAQVPSARKPAATPWRWVINEAVTGETNFFLLTSRYRPWADFMTGHLKGRPIGIEPVVDIKRFMVVAQGQPKPELVFGKSVNQLAKLVRDNGYQPVVRRADPYKAAFIVAKNSPIKTLADAARARIVMPDEYAATTAVARAELRRQNITNAEIVHVRFQEAVAQQVKSGAGQVGVVNPTTARKWAEEGGRVIAETQPVVNWSVLASPHVAPDTVAQLQEALLGMNTRETAILGALGIKEWAKAERKDFLALLDYTKE
jgi:ABC-type phosphate/phosphonate transport system substrate-binding protein